MALKDEGGGSGPGGHPGVTLVMLTGDKDADTAALEQALESGFGELKGFYSAGISTFAVFVNGYK